MTQSQDNVEKFSRFEARNGNVHECKRQHCCYEERADKKLKQKYCGKKGETGHFVH
jgi:hypothetical protein